MKFRVRKSLLILISLLFVGYAMADTSLPQPQTSKEDLDAIVAVVNSDIITRSQLDKEMALAKQQLQAANAPMPPEKELQKDVLDRMIERNLVLQIAKRNKVVISDAQVDDAINNVAKRNNLTIAQLKEAVANQGMSYKSYRQQLQDQMLVSEIQHRAVGNVVVTDEEAKNYLKTHKNEGAQEYLVQDILVSIPANATAAQTQAAQNQANNILKQARAGETISNDQGVQTNDLGWRTTAQMPTLFAKQVATMKAGEVSSPVLAPNGYHIIKLVELRSTAGQQQLTVMQARQILYQQKVEAKTDPWLKQLRETAYIKIIPQS